APPHEPTTIRLHPTARAHPTPLLPGHPAPRHRATTTTSTTPPTTPASSPTLPVRPFPPDPPTPNQGLAITPRPKTGRTEHSTRPPQRTEQPHRLRHRHAILHRQPTPVGRLPPHRHALQTGATLITVGCHLPTRTPRVPATRSGTRR